MHISSFKSPQRNGERHRKQNTFGQEQPCSYHHRLCLNNCVRIATKCQ